MQNRFLAKKYLSDNSNALSSVASLLGESDIINLSIGDPDFTTDEVIIHGAFKDATLGHTRRHNCEPNPRFWTEERKQQARELHDSGLTWEEVGEIIGVTKSAAYQQGGAYRYV
jgi:aspartate/methionine/tyrosine aminotransferase